MAVVGLPGAGKSEVVAEFVAAGFTKVYFGGLTLEKINEAGLEINEANERLIREKLRADHGMAAYAKLNLPKIESGLKLANVVIDGLYSWEEYLVLREKFPSMTVVAVYGPPRLRYQRLADRPVRPLTSKECQGRDYSQIENLHQAGPIAMAEQTVANIGTLADLKKTVRELINAQES